MIKTDYINNRDLMKRVTIFKISWILGMQFMLVAFILAAAYVPGLSWLSGGPVFFPIIIGILFFIFFMINLKISGKFTRLYKKNRSGKNPDWTLLELIFMGVISLLFLVQPFIVPHAVALIGPTESAVKVENLREKNFRNVEEITEYRFSKNGIWRYQNRVLYPRIGKVRGSIVNYNVFPLLPDRDPLSAEKIFWKFIHTKDFRIMIDEYRKEISPDKKLAWVHIDDKYLDPFFILPVNTFGNFLTQEILFKNKNVFNAAASDNQAMTVLRADPLEIPYLINSIRAGSPGMNLTSSDARNIFVYTPRPSDERLWMFFLVILFYIFPNTLYVISVLNGNPSSAPYLPAADEDMKKLSILNRFFFRK